MVVLEPSAPRTPEVEETFTRLEAELRASGFDVQVLTFDGDEPRAALEDALTKTSAAAAITIHGRAEVWVRDRLTGKLVVREDASQSGSPQLVAIHSVELLRASLLELEHPGASKVDDPKKPIPDPVKALIGPVEPTRPASSAWAGFGVELGVGTLVHFDPPLPMVVPVLRLSVGSAIGFGGRVSLVGPSIGPDLRGEGSVSELMVSGEGFFAPRLPWPFELIGFAGLGVYRVGAASALAADPDSRSGSSVGVIFTFGAGTGVRLADHFTLDLNLFGAVSAPRVVIDSGPNELGSLGQPILGATTGIRAAF